MARNEEVFNKLKELIIQQNDELSLKTKDLINKISYELQRNGEPNQRKSSLLKEAEELYKKYLPEINKIKDEINEDVRNEKSILSKDRNYIFGKSKNLKELKALQKKLSLDLPEKEKESLQKEIAKTIQKSINQRDYSIYLNDSEKTKEQIDEDINQTIQELEKLISVKGNHVQNQQKMIREMESKNKPLLDMIKQNQTILKDFDVFVKGASFDKNYDDEIIEEVTPESTLLEGEEDLIVSDPKINENETPEPVSEEGKSPEEIDDSIITGEVPEENVQNEPSPEIEAPILEEESENNREEANEEIKEEEAEIEEVSHHEETEDEISRISQLPLDSSKDFISQYKNYMNNVTDEMLDEKGDFNPMMRSKVRSVIKMIEKESGRKKFNGDVFFAQVYKKGFFTGKPKFFSGKISENNTKQLDQMIQDFETLSANGKMSEEQKQTFLRYVVYPKQFNDMKKNPPVYEEMVEEPDRQVNKNRQESEHHYQEDAQRTFQDELAGNVVNPNEIDETNHGSTSGPHRRPMTR